MKTARIGFTFLFAWLLAGYVNPAGPPDTFCMAFVVGLLATMFASEERR